MTEARRNFLVGLFVLLGLGALGTLIVLFGQAPTWALGARTYGLVIYFDTASGIRPGTQVTVAGKEIGRVSQVRFKDPADLGQGVEVLVAVEQQYRLHRGSRAETFQAGLLAGGRPPISIVPGPPDEPLLGPGDFIPGQVRGAVNAIFPERVVDTFKRSATQISEAADALKPVLQDLHEIMQPRSIQEVDRPGGRPGNLSTAMARIDLTLRNVNEVIGDPQVKKQLKESIANMQALTDNARTFAADLKDTGQQARQVVTEARTLVSDARGSLGRIDAHVERVARKLTGGLDQASDVLAELRAAAQAINRGQGTIGQLVVDPKLYEALVLTFRRLAETTAEFRALIKEWQKGKIRVTAF